MLTWFMLAFGAAISNSLIQLNSKWAVSMSKYSKTTITFVGFLVASAILLGVSYFIIGLPTIDNRFWLAVTITSVLNFVAFPMLLRAYEIGEFSSVFSMILLTPVFMLATSALFLDEIPSWLGGAGVLLTVAGLWFASKNGDNKTVPDYKKGNLYGMGVALIYSISVNFDKLAAGYSDAFMAPAINSAIMAVCYGLYLLAKHKAFLVPNDSNGGTHPFKGTSLLALVLLGITLAGSNILHNSALLSGYASYTIAIKRMGVIFGILWGWLFFHEKNIGRKMLGVAAAVAGVVMIVLS